MKLKNVKIKSEKDKLKENKFITKIKKEYGDKYDKIKRVYREEYEQNEKEKKLEKIETKCDFVNIKEKIKNIEIKRELKIGLYETKNGNREAKTNDYIFQGDCNDFSEELDPESWFRSAYPVLYEDYITYDNRPLPDTSSDICKMCNLRVPIERHYGVECCERDRQFIKRTFYEQIIYPPCEEAADRLCPQMSKYKNKDYCRYCRLKQCLQSGLDLKLIRSVETRLRRSIRKYSQRAVTSDKKLMESEEWLKEVYPSFYEDYLNHTEPVTSSFNICTICHLSPTNGMHYGIKSCESDRQFLKRTFHGKLVYKKCEEIDTCEPKKRGWCQYCRLGECLKSGLDLRLIRLNPSKTTKPKANIEASKYRVKKEAKNKSKVNREAFVLEPTDVWIPLSPRTLTEYAKKSTSNQKWGEKILHEEKMKSRGDPTSDGQLTEEELEQILLDARKPRKLKPIKQTPQENQQLKLLLEDAFPD